jgi:PAS domain S-box-containing protein
MDANPAACRLLGVDRDDILSMKVWDIVPADERGPLEERWRQFHRDGALSGQIRLQTRGGEHRDVEYRAAANFVPSLHMFILRDLTEMRRVERAVEQQVRESHEQVRRASVRARARREQDRTSIARELHDQLGQALTGLKIGLHWLGERLVDGRTPPEDLSRKIASLMGLADDTIVSVRRISSQLRPPVLDRLGLVAAIEWHAREFQRDGIRIVMDVTERPIVLDLGRSTSVFRIFQEALTNVARHARATRVTVTIRASASSMTLVVSDNGVGILPDRLMAADALGLIGMRERALALDGEVDVRRGARAGTVVTLKIPIVERRAVSRDDG